MRKSNIFVGAGNCWRWAHLTGGDGRKEKGCGIDSFHDVSKLTSTSFQSRLNGISTTCSSAFAWPTADRPSEAGRPIKTDSQMPQSNRFGNPFLSLAPNQCCPLPRAG